MRLQTKLRVRVNAVFNFTLSDRRSQSALKEINFRQVTAYFFHLTYLKACDNEEDNLFTDKVLRC